MALFLPSRTRFVLGCGRSPLRRNYSIPNLQKSGHYSPLLSRPFEDFFESPVDVNAGITSSSFEPFSTKGLPLLLKANLVNEILPNTYEITEKGSAILQELDRRMEKAKSKTGPWRSFFQSNFARGSGIGSTFPRATSAYSASRDSLKTLWTELGALVYEVEEPTYLRPTPTGMNHHLYISMSGGPQTLLHCSNCSITQLASYALTKRHLSDPNTPPQLDVRLSALRHPISDVFYALVTRIGTTPHEERIRAALLASCSPALIGPRNAFVKGSVPARILVDESAGTALSGQAAKQWFDRLRLSMEQACPKVMGGRTAELDRHLGRVFVPTAPGTSSTGTPSSLIPHHGHGRRAYARGFIIGNFRTAGEASDEACMSCSGQLDSIKGAWVAKVALKGSEIDSRSEGEVSVRVLNPLPMLAALAAAGTLIS
ncbi:hypothetical protein RSOLAG1IB_01143 [Rhizoctonia solani AG-1 IB]|uniref:Uncharacterized protein n=1 Tax=Thanatephorus cucumeris (strain AG1-IB / isolate 7/3/14) TaxID=1108050 RepID=A0A0B7FC60_THACB|nr:hypothetical protein RSOLAG1IB_01143 [Rhizoctonia solani AG-1 IB]